MTTSNEIIEKILKNWDRYIFDYSREDILERIKYCVKLDLQKAIQEATKETELWRNKYFVEQNAFSEHCDRMNKQLQEKDKEFLEFLKGLLFYRVEEGNLILMEIKEKIEEIKNSIQSQQDKTADTLEQGTIFKKKKTTAPKEDICECGHKRPEIIILDCNELSYTAYLMYWEQRGKLCWDCFCRELEGKK